MHGVENKVGRLIELWVESPITTQEGDDIALDVRQAVIGNQGRVVICVDLVLAKVFAPEVAQKFTATMKSDNPKIERSGFILARRAATFAMQFERMIKEAANPARRTFQKQDEMEAWLGEVLTISEKARMHEFLHLRKQQWQLFGV